MAFAMKGNLAFFKRFLCSVHSVASAIEYVLIIRWHACFNLCIYVYSLYWREKKMVLSCSLCWHQKSIADIELKNLFTKLLRYILQIFFFILYTLIALFCCCCLCGTMISLFFFRRNLNDKNKRKLEKN